MNIKVLSQRAAENFTHDKPWACISIVNKPPWPNLSEENRVGLLQLDFADISSLMDDYKRFTAYQAEQILSFVRTVKDNIDLLMIHCYAGISRSSGVAAAISKIYTGTDMEYFNSKIYCPNSWVYSTILKVHYAVQP